MRPHIQCQCAIQHTGTLEKENTKWRVKYRQKKSETQQSKTGESFAKFPQRLSTQNIFKGDSYPDTKAMTLLSMSTKK